MIGVGKIGLAAYRGGGGAVPVNPDFVTTWNVVSDGETVTLPLLSAGTFSGTIDWGDSSTSALSYANRAHTYTTAGTYTITISGDTLAGWAFQNAGDKAKITEISNWGLFEFTDIRTFQGCLNMDITATDTPTISTTNFTSNFYGCDGISTVQNWSAWDMSGVTNYQTCFAENDAFNGSLDNWVHSSVTTLTKMFNNATQFSGDLDTWDVSGVTAWTEFARGATSFNGDVSNWTPSGAMTNAFLGCSSFEGNGCSTWDVSGVTSMLALFSQCVNFSADISGWDTSSVTVMTSMLRNCGLFDRDISGWDINQVTAFTNFMTDATGLSTSNYDALLVAWEAQAPQTGINVNFGGSTFTSGSAAATAKASLQTTYSWIITDGGAV
jgi:surface protein